MSLKCKNKVAILMATFNGKAFIREQLDSLLSQSFSDFCLYVHDDGSNDGTKDILEEYQNGHSDKIVILDTPPCGGAKSNFMHLLCEVDADYYFFCDQDDVWDNKKIEKMFHVMVDKEDKDIPFALFSDLFVVNSDMTKLADSYFDYCGYNPKRTYYRQILIQNFIPGCALCFNKATAMMARSFSDLRNIYMHDCTAPNSVMRLFFVKTNHRRGGFIENVYMKNVQAGTAQRVLEIDTEVLYQWKDLVPTYEERITRIDGIYMDKVTCESADAIYELKGDAKLPVKNVTIKNVKVGEVKKFVKKVNNVENVVEKNVTYEREVK